MLFNYRFVLKQRRLWKNIVIDRNLVEVNMIKAHEQGSNASLINKYKWLVQYISKKDFNLFIKRLLKEKELRELKISSSMGKCINEAKIKNFCTIFSDKENELCIRLKIPHLVYAKLKRLAIECFINKKPLKNILFSLFLKKKINE